MEHVVKIKQKVWLTYDVMQFILEKPKGFTFKAGQAVEVTLDKPEFKEKWSPFTITSLHNDKDLEFMIKMYPDHNGITLALSKLKEGDHFRITDPWDSFENKGPGVFIAGGTGITPFVALLRQMETDGTIDGSMLIFSNKTERDIFLDEEFIQMLGNNFKIVLTREETEPYIHGRINKKFLENYISNFSQPFYLCGPEGFAEEIKDHLKELGVGDKLVNLSL